MTRKYRGAYAAIPHVVDLYFELMNKLNDDKSCTVIMLLNYVIKLPKFNHLDTLCNCYRRKRHYLVILQQIRNQKFLLKKR
jgi:hypothetical protein